MTASSTALPALVLNKSKSFFHYDFFARSTRERHETTRSSFFFCLSALWRSAVVAVRVLLLLLVFHSLNRLPRTLRSPKKSNNSSSGIKNVSMILQSVTSCAVVVVSVVACGSDVAVAVNAGVLLPCVTQKSTKCRCRKQEGKKEKKRKERSPSHCNENENSSSRTCECREFRLKYRKGCERDRGLE